MRIILILGIFLSFANKSYANAPIGGAMLLSLQMVSLGPSVGLSLLIAMLIEMLVLKNRLRTSYWQAIKLSLYANLFSTLMGVGIVIAYSSGSLFLICWFLGAFALYHCFNFMSLETGFCQNFLKSRIIKFLMFVFFLGLGLVGLIMGGVLLPSPPMFIPKPPVHVPDPFSITVVIPFMFLLITGFIITFITEGSIIVKYHQKKSKSIILTVFLMNFFSYLALLPCFMLFSWALLMNWYQSVLSSYL